MADPQDVINRLYEEIRKVKQEGEGNPDANSGVLWSQKNTGFYKELQRHEKPYIPGVTPKIEFPKMLIKAQQYQGQKYLTSVRQPEQWEARDGADWLRMCEMVDNFNKSCQRIVQNEAEERQAISQGWRENPKAALEYANRYEDEMARVAAHVAYEDRNMSDAAKAEKAEVEASTERHVLEVPEAPKAKRAYVRKTAAV